MDIAPNSGKDEPLPPNPVTPPTPPEDPNAVERYGKGAIPTPPEVQQMHYALAAGAPPVIDWSVPYRVAAALVQKDQDGSSSCTAQATNYYVEVLNQLEHGFSEVYSSRFIYSQTSLGQDQGTYIWKAMSIPIKYGAASMNSVPEGNRSETTMRNASENWQAVLEARTAKYAVISRTGQSMDYMAQIVRDYHGFVTGFKGHNRMFDGDGMVIDWSKNDWGHCVYVCGYEMHKGKKCLVYKNSWGSAWGDGGFGYFPEEFVRSGTMFDAYVYASVANLDPQSIMLTAKQVALLQALEGYYDEEGINFWTGKLLADYFAARMPHKIAAITAALETK